MTVLLVLATFLVFVVLDYAMNRTKAIALVPVVDRRLAIDDWSASPTVSSFFAAIRELITVGD